MNSQTFFLAVEFGSAWLVKWFNERRAMARDIHADPNLLERNRKILSRYYMENTKRIVPIVANDVLDGMRLE
jgi:hypothetical protein